MAATPATTTPPAATAAMATFVPVVSPLSASVLFVVVSASPVTVATVVYDVVTVNSVTVDLYVSPFSTDVLFVVEMRNSTFLSSVSCFHVGPTYIPSYTCSGRHSTLCSPFCTSMFSQTVHWCIPSL